MKRCQLFFPQLNEGMSVTQLKMGSYEEEDEKEMFEYWSFNLVWIKFQSPVSLVTLSFADISVVRLIL